MTGKFDPEICIRLLLDKTEPEYNRDAAAESLGYGEVGPSLPRVVDALFQVACDQADAFDIREEAAQSLGEIWGRIGVDRERFARVPEDVRFEVWASMPETEATKDLGPPHP